MVAGAYVCGIGFFAGGGVHQLGGILVLPGLLLWVGGGICAIFDMSFPERRRTGIAALVAAVGFWPAFSWTLGALTGR
jgi:hypothetical protein